MPAAESNRSAATRSNLTEQVQEHFDAGKLPLDAIADSDFPVTAADDRYPAWHPDTYPSDAIVKALLVGQLGSLNFARLHRALLSQPDGAASLRFDPD